MKKLLIGFAFTALMLVGCGTNDDTTNNDDRNQADPKTDENQEAPLNDMDKDDEVRDGDNQYDVSKEAADKITDKVDDIKRVTVLTTDNNAYVGAQLDKGKSDKTGDEVTDETKKEITDIIKDVDGDIDNVYVTTNPDFANLLDNYSNDLDEGKPITGLFDEIGTMIERLFPQNKE